MHAGGCDKHGLPAVLKSRLGIRQMRHVQVDDAREEDHQCGVGDVVVF